MKRAITRGVCLLLLMSILLLQVACTPDQERFVGKWSAQVDLTELITQKAKQNPQLSGHLKISNFTFTVNYDFKQDGSYTVKCDKNTCLNAFEKVKIELADSVKNMLMASAEDMGLDMTLEQILAKQNTTVDEIVLQNLDQDIIDEIIEFFDEEGYYKAKKGKLYRLESLDDPLNETPYELYEMTDDNKIKIYDVLGSVFQENQIKFTETVYPILLERN